MIKKLWKKNWLNSKRTKCKNCNCDCHCNVSGHSDANGVCALKNVIVIHKGIRSKQR